MPYRFKLDEPIASGVRRIAREQIARAGLELDRVSAGGAAAGIHESRKAIKRLRALLRLLRPQIGQKAFKVRNVGLKEIAAKLSASRDHSILDETITKLEGRFGHAGVKALAPLRSTLARGHTGAQDNIGSPASETIREKLAQEGRWLDELTFDAGGFEIVAEGLELSYRRGRAALAKASKKPTDDRVHDLRKSVQWHWRQMALLSRAWPEYFNLRAAAAREISQILGDDHDLAVLLHFAKSDRGARAPESGQIENMIRMRQYELRAQAYPRAARLFAEPPKAFGRRIACYWETAGPVKIRGETSSEDVRDRQIPGTLPAQPNVTRLTVMADNDDPSQRRA